MIGVARRSGLTVVASSYENKTLLKKEPLLDLTRVHARAAHTELKKVMRAKVVCSLYGSYRPVPLAFVSPPLPPPPPLPSPSCN